MNQKGLAPIAIMGTVIFFLIIAGGFGYYLINKSNQAKVNNKIQEQNSIKAEEGCIYVVSVKKTSGTGILYYEKEYFMLNSNGEKVKILTIPDMGYVYGWDNYFDRNFESKDLSVVEKCKIQNEEFDCIKNTNTLDVLFIVDYKKENQIIFSLNKKAHYILNKEQNALVLDDQFSQISQNQINGLFNDNNEYFFNNNKNDLYQLAKEGKYLQKLLIDDFIKKFDITFEKEMHLLQEEQEITISNENNASKFYLNENGEKVILKILPLGDYIRPKYINDNFYVIEKKLIDEGWYINTLWRYDKENNKEKLASYVTPFGFEYYPSSNGEYIAIYNYGLSGGDETISFIKKDGTPIKDFPHEASSPFYYSFFIGNFEWINNDFWITGVGFNDLGQRILTDVVKIEMDNNLKILKFDISNFDIYLDQNR